MTLARFRATFAALLVLASFGAAAATIEVPQLRMPDFKRLERELRLRPEQKAQYDVAVASLQRTLLASAGIFMELKQQLADELVKPRPDFRRLFSSQRAAFDMLSPLLQETLDEWSKLYALLEQDQLVIAKRFLQDALPRWP
jgi:hypothetical protein